MGVAGFCLPFLFAMSKQESAAWAGTIEAERALCLLRSTASSSTAVRRCAAVAGGVPAQHLVNRLISRVTRTATTFPRLCMAPPAVSFDFFLFLYARQAINKSIVLPKGLMKPGPGASLSKK